MARLDELTVLPSEFQRLPGVPRDVIRLVTRTQTPPSNGESYPKDVTVINRSNYYGGFIPVNRPDMRCRLTPQVVEWLTENHIPFEQNSIRHKKRAASVRVRFETLLDAMQFKMRWC